MNPLTNVRNIQNLNKRELKLGVPFTQSWHQQYRDSAWIFIGGLDYDLTEGDIICLFSQYGEIVNINLIRDQKTGKSKGFAFLCYENQLSTVLSVDNLNSIKLCGRTIRVDHVEEYKVPKMKEDMAPEKIKLALEGCAPQLQRPSLVGGAGDRGTKPPPIKTEQHEGDLAKNGRASSGHTSHLKTEPSQPCDDIILPPRLFDASIKENSAAKHKNNKEKKKKKSNKKSKSKKSSKSKCSDLSASSSNSEDDSDSGHKYSGRNKLKRTDSCRNKTGESSSARDRGTDRYSTNYIDPVTGSRSRREVLPGGYEYSSRVKEEPFSDDSDIGRRREHDRRFDDKGTVSQSRFENSRNGREDDYRRVDRNKRKREDDNESRRKHK